MGDKGTAGRLRGVEAAEGVHTEDALVFLLGEVQEVLHEVDARVAEHDVEAAEHIIGRLDHGVHALAVGHVAVDAAAVLRAELGGDLLEGIGLDVAYDYLAALSDKAGGDGAAYAARTAGDYADLAGKPCGVH